MAEEKSKSKEKKSAKEKKQKVYDTLSAIQTLLSRLPKLTVPANETPKTVFGYLLDLLDKLGWTKEKVLDFIADKLSDENGFLTSVEDVIKALLMANIKNLLTCSMNPFIPNSMMYYYENNVTYDKNNCIKGEGLGVSIDEIDLYGILSLCPVSKEGRPFYFDCVDSLWYSGDTVDRTVDNPFYSPKELYKSMDFNAFLWYVIHKGVEADPNTFKLYWDNRVRYLKRFSSADGSKTEGNYLANQFLGDDVRINEYGSDGSKSLTSGNKYLIKDARYPKNTQKNGIYKKDIIICKYTERGEDKTSANTLRVWLNPGTYYHRRLFHFTLPKLKEQAEEEDKDTSSETATNGSTDYQSSTDSKDTQNKKSNKKKLSANIKNAAKNGGTAAANAMIDSVATSVTEGIKNYGDAYYDPTTGELTVNLNKTLFEFNFDYIYSLKLFSPKTLIADIINAMFGVINTLDIKYSKDKAVVAEAVSSIIQEAINSDDEEQVITDCSFEFDNIEYDELLNKATQKQLGIITDSDGNEYNVNAQEIVDSLSSMQVGSNLSNDTNSVSNVLKNLSVSGATNGAEISKYTLSSDFITNLLNETVTQITMQVLSPKVALLFKINEMIMGQVDTIAAKDIGNSTNSLKTQGKKVGTEIKNAWTQFVKDLKNTLMKIAVQISKMLVDILLSAVINELTVLIGLFVAQLAKESIKYYREALENLINNCVSTITNLIQFGSATGISVIDNVNYAEIEYTQTTPKSDSCG